MSKKKEDDHVKPIETSSVKAQTKKKTEQGMVGIWTIESPGRFHGR